MDAGGADDIPVGSLESVPGLRHEPISFGKEIQHHVLYLRWWVEQVWWRNHRTEAHDLLHRFLSVRATGSFSRLLGG